MPTTILLVDDHPVFRKGLRLLLEEEQDLSVVGEASDGREAIDLARELSPDVVVMDITMPNLSGIDATRQILTESPDTKVVALSVHSGKRFVRDMLQAGAVGYILKECVPEEMIEGIRTVKSGDVYLSKSISGIVVSEYMKLLSETDGMVEIPYEPILRTKLHRPPVALDILPRARLLELLNQGRSTPLTLISAAAGYGKSTLASKWIEACDCPSAWVSLDEDDNDLRLFVTYLLSGIRTAFPTVGQEIQTMLSAPSLPRPSVLARTLINDLDTIEEKFILVLDDYHRIHETAIHDLMAEVLRHPLRAMHLVLLTRRDPPLPLMTLRASGQVNEITMEQLRFTRSETAAFLQRALDVSIDDTTAAILEKKIEGWVTGLRLAAFSLRGQKDLDRLVSGLREGFQYITDYLVTEVVSRQPPAMARYLMETAILDRFCAALCEAIHLSKGEPGGDEISGQEFIEWLEKAHLFVIPLDDQHRWFRYHRLFQDLLQSQLKRRYSTEEIATLHYRASEWFGENGLIDEAIPRALAAGDVISAAQWVEQNRQAMLNSDRWFVLEKWLSMLPDTVIQERPGLLMARVWILYHHFDLPTIPSVIDAAESLLSDAPIDQPLRGEIDFFRGYLYYFQNEGSHSLKHLQAALKRVPEAYHEIRGQIEILYGLASQMQGLKEEAVNTLSDLLYHHRMPQSVRKTRLLATLVYIHIIAGDLDKALVANQQLRDVATKGNHAYATVWSSYLQGLIHFYGNDLESAIDHFRQAIEQKYILHTRAAIDGWAGLAFCYQAMGQPGMANAAMKGLFDYVDLLNDPTCSMIAHSCHARLSIMQGEPKSATGWSRESPPPLENMVWWLEIPAVTHCRALLAEGSDESLEKAEIKLRELLQLNHDNHNTCHMIHIMPLLALALKKKERFDEALTILERAVDLAKPGGWIRPFIELGPPMAELLKRLIAKNIAVDYTEKLLAAFRDEEQVAVPEVPEHPGESPPAPHSPDSQPLVEPPTNRELEILELLAQRRQNKEISEKLFISTETVKSHLKNIFGKLNVSNRRQAVQRAKNLNIL